MPKDERNPPATLRAEEYGARTRTLYYDARRQVDAYGRMRIVGRVGGSLRVLHIDAERWQRILLELGYQEFRRLLADGPDRLLHWGDRLHDIEVMRLVAQEELWMNGKRIHPEDEEE